MAWMKGENLGRATGRQATAWLAVAALAVSVPLAGCLDGQEPESSATLREMGGNEAVGEPIEAETTLKRTVFHWEGQMEGEACLYTSGGGCSMAVTGLSDDKPENHKKWYEVEIDQSLTSGQFEIAWTVNSGPDPEMEFALQCQEPRAKPCHEGETDVAQTQGTQPPLTLTVADLSWFGGDDRMWIYIGVVPQQTPAGEYYPDVDIDFEAGAEFHHE